MTYTPTVKRLWVDWNSMRGDEVAGVVRTVPHGVYVGDPILVDGEDSPTYWGEVLEVSGRWIKVRVGELFLRFTWHPSLAALGDTDE